MTRSHVMIYNVIASYGRLFVCAFMGLLASRWVLAALGEIDFGLFGVIGGIMAFLGFINLCMAGSAQRHFAYSIGQGDVAEVRQWFNSAMVVHGILAALILAAGIPVGYVMIQSVLNIPENRTAACMVVYAGVLIYTALSVASVPMIGMFNAKQKIALLALFALIGSIFNLILAYWLLNCPGDRLVFYGLGVSAINGGLLLAQCWVAVYFFPECKLILRGEFDRRRIRELLSFAGWTLFGVLGNLGRSSGIVILVNIFWGPKMNSALGVANQLAGQAEQISAGLFTALSPEITTSSGRSEHDRVLDLSLRASRFSVFLSCLIVVPLLSELDFLLQLWLKNVPELTGAFCWIILLVFMAEKFTSGYMVMVSAHGKIAGYQASLGSILILTLPLAALLAWLGGSPVMVVGCSVLTTVACVLGRIFWVKRLFDVPPRVWVLKVLLPVLKVVIPLILAAALIHGLMADSLWRLIVSFLLLPLGEVILVWLLGFDAFEKEFVIKLLNKILFFRRH